MSQITQTAAILAAPHLDPEAVTNSAVGAFLAIAVLLLGIVISYGLGHLAEVVIKALALLITKATRKGAR